MNAEPFVNNAIRFAYKYTNVAGPIHYRCSKQHLADQLELRKSLYNTAANRWEAARFGAAAGATQGALAIHNNLQKPFAILDGLLGRSADRPYASIGSFDWASLQDGIGVVGYACTAAAMVIPGGAAGLVLPRSLGMVIRSFDMSCLYLGLATGLGLALNGAHPEVATDHSVEVIAIPTFRIDCQLASLLGAAVKLALLIPAAIVGAMQGVWQGVTSSRPTADSFDRSDCYNDTTLQSSILLAELPEKSFFRLEDGYGFDVDELCQANLGRSEWTNPYTNKPFTKTDVERLSRHPCAGTRKLLAERHSATVAARRLSQQTVLLLKHVAENLNHADPDDAGRTKAGLVGVFAEHISLLQPNQRADLDRAMTSYSGETLSSAMRNLNPSSSRRADSNGCANATAAYFRDQLSFIEKARKPKAEATHWFG